MGEQSRRSGRGRRARDAVATSRRVARTHAAAAEGRQTHGVHVINHRGKDDRHTGLVHDQGPRPPVEPLEEVARREDFDAAALHHAMHRGKEQRPHTDLKVLDGEGLREAKVAPRVALLHRLLQELLREHRPQCAQQRVQRNEDEAGVFEEELVACAAYLGGFVRHTVRRDARAEEEEGARHLRVRVDLCLQHDPVQDRGRENLHIRQRLERPSVHVLQAQQRHLVGERVKHGGHGEVQDAAAIDGAELNHAFPTREDPAQDAHDRQQLRHEHNGCQVERLRPGAQAVVAVQTLRLDGKDGGEAELEHARHNNHDRPHPRLRRPIRSTHRAAQPAMSPVARV